MSQERKARSRTKYQLWNALYHLMLEKGKTLQQITINDICQTAFVHRSTFYNHFSDKYDLFKFGFMIYAAEKEKYPVEQQLSQPFTLSIAINEKLQRQLLFSPLMKGIDEPFLDELLSEKLHLLLDQVIELQYELLIHKSVLIEMAVAIHRIVEKNILDEFITAQQGDFILEKYFMNVMKKSS